MAQLIRDFVKIENDFTVIPNEIARNKEMKSSTKNILIAMLSLPPTWDFSIAGITTCVREGYDTVQKALVELEQIGYITRSREHKEDGTFGAMVYTIHQFPVSEDKNTYKKNHKNQDVKKPKQVKTNNGKNQYRQKPVLENSIQLSIDYELNKDYESNTDSELSIDSELNTDNKYAFSDKSSKVDKYASVSEKQEVGQKPQKKSRYIPKDYTEEQLREHIRPVIDNYIEKNCGKLNKDEIKNNLLEVIAEFHREYEKKFGEKHRIIADVSYENIAERYLNPPEIMNGNYDTDAYSAMIEQYFIVEFNKRKKYNKPIEISLSHFMSDEIRGHLYWQTCV